ncbi:MAG: PIN/TRAM domain-containing protein [Clostridium sp.]
MIKNILKALLTFGGATLGYVLAEILIKTNLVNTIGILNDISQNNIKKLILVLVSILICALIVYLISPLIINFIIKGIDYIERMVQKRPTNELVVGTIGAIVGLLISTLFFNQIRGTSTIWGIITVIITVIITIICMDVAIRRKDDILVFMSNLKKGTSSSKEKKMKGKSSPKILDTSVIIDGRIFDLCQTGFIEGTLIIPQFVLDELRHIADSSDDLKRTKGRRGLDILNKIQTELTITVEISEANFKDIQEVDSKLLKLAQVINGKVITNDFNLNKVATFQGVEVLNINELANAIKPILLPGEELRIQIVKDGKESGQGVAYLDDGTMIVVEGGRKHVGELAEVVVTSVLQTSAGRMIFAKRKEVLGKVN